MTLARVLLLVVCLVPIAGVVPARALTPEEIKKITDEVVAAQKKQMDDLKKDLDDLKKDVASLKAKPDAMGKPKPLDDKAAEAIKTLTKPIEDVLYDIAVEGTYYYYMGQHETAAALFRGALRGQMKEIETLSKRPGAKEANVGLYARVKQAIYDADIEETGWRQAVLLRTAINDVLNYSRREIDTNDEHLVDRLGGHQVTGCILRDSFATSNLQDALYAGAGQIVFSQVIRKSGFSASVIPYYYFIQPERSTRPSVAPFHTLDRQLRLSLRNYSVPQPEAEVFVAKVRKNLTPLVYSIYGQ
jgi:hypothetical protein